MKRMNTSFFFIKWIDFRVKYEHGMFWNVTGTCFVWFVICFESGSEFSIWIITAHDYECDWKQHVVVVAHAQESDLAAPAEAQACQTPADLLLQTEERENESGYTQLDCTQRWRSVMILRDSCTSGSGMMTGSLSVRVMDSWLAVMPTGEIRSFRNTHLYISVFSFLYYHSFDGVNSHSIIWKTMDICKCVPL